MSVNLSPVGGAGAQFCDNNGNPLNGGKLYTYSAGTTTPAATYTSAAGSVFHTNPIVLNAGGRVPDSGEIWLSDNISYKFVLKTSADVLIATWDNINGINSNFVNYTIQEEVITATAGQTVFNLSTITYAPGTNSLAVYVDGVNQIVTDSYVETDANTVTFVSGLHVGALVKFTTATPATGTATDAAVVSYTPPFTGGVSTTVESKLAQYVSVKDFGAVGNGVVDDTAAIQAAIDYCQSSTSTPKNIHFSNGTYLVSATLNVKGLFADQGLLLYGDNAVIQSDAAFGGEQFNVDALTTPDNLRCNVRFQNLNFYGPGKSVSGSRAIIIAASTGSPYVSADVWVKDAVVSGFATGIVSNRGILLDFHDVTFKNNGVGFSSPDLSNSLTFTSCRWFSNDKAMYINQFSLGFVTFNHCQIEGNSLGGTSTDGVKCCEFTNAGHLTFNACHFESNNCQYNIHYSGTANDSSISFIGCEVIAGLGAQVWATGALITSVGSYISSGASTYDIYMDADCHATLIDSFTTTQGSSAANCTVIGGYSNQVTTGGTAFRFLNRTASLNDYEATTWSDATLSLINCSSATLSNATYTKVGRQVTVYGRISATLTTTATAVSVIFNLPVNTTANTSVAVGMVKHNLTTDGVGLVSDTTTGDPSQATLRIPASQVTVANGSAFVADFTFTYET